MNKREGIVVLSMNKRERSVFSFWKITVLFFLFVELLGCKQLSNEELPCSWQEAYLPINDQETDQFVAHAFHEAIAQFGRPVIPVKKVLLRRSKKKDEVDQYRIAENFSLTTCIDPTNGVFVIYIAVDPSHPNYFPLLGHECLHLLNVHIFDWYMEGMATRFSEEICTKNGKPWGNWKHRFERSRREPYAVSYRMMRDLQKKCPTHYSKLIHAVRENGKGSAKLCIDIDRWLKTLSSAEHKRALQTLAPYVKILKNQDREGYNFITPAALGKKGD